MNIISCQSAYEAGLKHYFTGKPCKRGHTDKRQVSDRSCCSCKNEVLKASYQSDPVKAQLRSERAKEWNSKNRERASANTYLWGLKNKARLRHYENKATQARDKRLPVWANDDLIKEVYLNCPEGYHVDHVIPLQGKLVSGLHVHNNLQYLLPYDNISKGNKFDPETFEGP